MCYKTSLVTIEVGSRGIPNPDGFVKIEDLRGYTNSQLTNLMVSASRKAIAGSFKNWTM